MSELTVINNSDIDNYVNDVLKIYNSDEYLKTLKESGYTQEEIKDFLNDIKQTSRENVIHLKNQQTRILSYILDSKSAIPITSNLEDTDTKNLKVNEPVVQLFDSSNDNPLTNKYLLASLSQSGYDSLMSIGNTI